MIGNLNKIIYPCLISLVFFSCTKEEGCTDPLATNYNYEAETEDNSCTYSIIGTWNAVSYELDGIDLMSPLLDPYIIS